MSSRKARGSYKRTSSGRPVNAPVNQYLDSSLDDDEKSKQIEELQQRLRQYEGEVKSPTNTKAVASTSKSTMHTRRSSKSPVSTATSRPEVKNVKPPAADVSRIRNVLKEKKTEIQKKGRSYQLLYFEDIFYKFNIFNLNLINLTCLFLISQFEEPAHAAKPFYKVLFAVYSRAYTYNYSPEACKNDLFLSTACLKVGLAQPRMKSPTLRTSPDREELHEEEEMHDSDRDPDFDVEQAKKKLKKNKTKRSECKIIYFLQVVIAQLCNFLLFCRVDTPNSTTRAVLGLVGHSPGL